MANLKENVEQSLEVLFKLETQDKTEKHLFEKVKIVYLKIALFRAPIVGQPIKNYLRLRHSLHGNEPEICLFVPNRKTGVEYKKSTDELIDFCVDYYTKLLEKHKIKGISTIIPLKQLRSEYGAYEMRRKLVRRYDLFLCKNSLLYNNRFVTALGKIFIRARRLPLGVAFPKPNTDFDPEFQENINRAIFTSSFVIKQNSDNYSIPIGTLSNTKNELKENLEMVLDQLVSEKMIPGGVENLKMIYLGLSQSKPIPLFINPEVPAKKQRPKVESRKKRNRAVKVEGELSTQPGKKVMVMPDGEVFVTKCEHNPEPESESESEDSFKDDSEDEDEKDEKTKTKVGKEEEEMKSESEGDEEIEEQEKRLLRKRKAEGTARGKENKSSKKENKEGKESFNVDVKTPRKEKSKNKGAKKGKNIVKSNRKFLMKQKTKSK